MAKFINFNNHILCTIIVVYSKVMIVHTYIHTYESGGIHRNVCSTFYYLRENITVVKIFFQFMPFT